MERSNGVEKAMKGEMDSPGIDESGEMKKAAAENKMESVGNVEADANAEMDLVNDLIGDFICGYTILAGIPSVVTTNRNALPPQFRELHKYLGRSVEVFISYDMALCGTLESLDGNLNLVLSDCYKDYYHSVSQNFLGTVRVDGKYLKFIGEL